MSVNMLIHTVDAIQISTLDFLKNLQSLSNW